MTTLTTGRTKLIGAVTIQRVLTGLEKPYLEGLRDDYNNLFELYEQYKREPTESTITNIRDLIKTIISKIRRPSEHGAKSSDAQNKDVEFYTNLGKLYATCCLEVYEPFCIAPDRMGSDFYPFCQGLRQGVSDFHEPHGDRIAKLAKFLHDVFYNGKFTRANLRDDLPIEFLSLYPNEYRHNVLHADHWANLVHDLISHLGDVRYFNLFRDKRLNDLGPLFAEIIVLATYELGYKKIDSTTEGVGTRVATHFFRAYGICQMPDGVTDSSVLSASRKLAKAKKVPEGFNLMLDYIEDDATRDMRC